MKGFNTVMQTFALNNEGKVVYVDEVPRGADCCCRCPGCDSPLVARQGDIRGWHFAHRHDSTCEGAAETALHLAAKQLIGDELALMLPGLLVSETHIGQNGMQHSGSALIDPCWIDFDQVVLEPTVGVIRPDVVALNGSRSWIVEIRVSHAVGDEKREIIANLGWPAVEITLNLPDREIWTRDDLRKEVIDRHDNKTWLFHPDRQLLVEKAKAAARAEAAAQDALHVPVPSLGQVGIQRVPIEPIRHRFKVRDMIVDATERDFAITVWSSFHPEVTPMVAEVCKRLGGVWRRQYRNWVISHFNRDALLEQLAILANNRT